MITESISLPHPVLGISDDITGRITMDINVQKNTNDKIEFLISNVNIDNEYFRTLLISNKISLQLKMYCSSTYKTWVFKINEEARIEIDQHEVCNKVEIEPYIIAEENIDNYSDDSFNEEYDGKTFSVRKYELLGMLGKLTIPIDKEYEQLGIDSLFEFAGVDNPSQPISFELNQDKILIQYPITLEGDHPPNGLFHQSPWAAYNMIIIPALTEAFRILSDLDRAKDVEGKQWVDILNSMLPLEERDEDPFKSAQILLDRKIPLLSAYQEICKN